MPDCETLRSAVEQAEYIIAITDVGGYIRYVNPAFERVTGYSHAQAIGRKMSLLKSGRQDVSFYARLWKTVRAGDSFQARFVNRRKDGQLYFEDKRITPIRGKSGRITGYLSCSQNTTEAMDDNGIAMVENHHAAVAHDLRSPLRAIIGFARALGEEACGDLGEHCREYLRRIESASQRMSRMIDDLIALPGVSRVELRLEPVDLSAIAAEIADELRIQQPSRSIAFHITPDVAAVCDKVLIEVLLQNLLENAWKFTERKPLAVIEFGMEDTPTGAVYFVRDNGAGFEPAHAHKMFLPFQRLHTGQEFDGHGIGLATVAGIVRRHGGRIWAEGAPDAGAIFRFSLDTPDLIGMP